jgi:hypothetical protein
MITATYSLSAPGGGEGWGEVGDAGVFDADASGATHLTLPRLRRKPLPLRPEGRRGAYPAAAHWVIPEH